MPVRRWGAVLLVLVIGSIASAEGRTATPTTISPPVSGLYESWSPIQRRPVGPLKKAPDASRLARWLDVGTTGQTSTVAFLPEGRVVWLVSWGPHGPTEKVTEVDGEAWIRSVFEYDDKGRLARKKVDGAGVANAAGPGGGKGPWVFTYEHDAAGRVIERSGPLVLRHSRISAALPAKTAIERWLVSYGARTTTARTLIDGVERRKDSFNLHGLSLRTDFGAPALGTTTVSLLYKRDVRGRLRQVMRVLKGQRRPARPDIRESRVTSSHLEAFYHSLAERYEVLLALGSPVTHSDNGRGRTRRISDHYSDGCWLNEVSSLEYDAAGVLVTSWVGCVCGFCVDAALPVEAPPHEVDGVDLHWTEGPWVRLDESVDVTAEHSVLTPSGAVPAGLLRAGDEVYTPDWRVRVLTSVRRLPPGPERLGRNVRTQSGTFGAAGILFASEPPCELPH